MFSSNKRLAVEDCFKYSVISFLHNILASQDIVLFIGSLTVGLYSNIHSSTSTGFNTAVTGIISFKEAHHSAQEYAICRQKFIKGLKRDIVCTDYITGVATIESPERTHPSPYAVHNFLLRNLVKCGICYGKVCLSVRPSVCHTRELRLNASRYRNVLFNAR